MAAERGIHGWQHGQVTSDEANRDVLTAITTLTANPIAGIPDHSSMRIAQRIEEFTQIVGRMAQSGLTAILAAIISTSS